MSLTSDSGACSVSSSDACPRDNSDPEEEAGDAEEYDDEFELDAAGVSEAEAAAAAAAFLNASARIDDGIEFVNDPAVFAAAAAAASGCVHHRGQRRGAGRARGGAAAPGGLHQNGAARPPARSGGGRAYSQERERVRRERFIDLYGKLQTAIPNLQGIKRATHRKILTETAAYLATTIAQIKARRRVNKLRALLAQLESDASYVRRLSGIQRHRPTQRADQHPQLVGAASQGGPASAQRAHQAVQDESPTVLAIGDCFLIG